jgi:N-acetylneuraminic acid mutarotase
MRTLLSGGVFATLALFTATLAHGRELTFQDRARAEEAILRVYYAHQVGATRAFDEAVPRAVIEDRVRRYLVESAALQRFWGGGPTSEDLRHEVDRIAAASRLPDRLQEIFDALGRDPVLIQECLARPVLVDRWARAMFAADPRFRGRSLSAPEQTDEMQRAWDAFLRSASASLDPASVKTVARDEVPVPVRLGSPAAATSASGAACVPNDRWEAAALGGSPVPREGHTAVWTGSVMIVWGGGDPYVNTGGRYDPILDTWTPTSVTNAPLPRRDHTAVWTGTRMIVWGGQGNLVSFGDGASYDPVADAWSPISGVNPPSRRWLHTAVWTGSKMIVWGGRDSRDFLATGAQYDPGSDTWTVTPVTASTPTPRAYHTAVWAGDRMVIFGGENFGGPVLADGAALVAATNAWTALSPAPSARMEHTAVWSGREMIVWGGSDGTNALGSGARYDPAADSWTPVATAGAPSPRYYHVSVWSVGYGMLVWGGHDGTTRFGDGARYVPDTDSWIAISLVGAPAPHALSAAVWTGDQMVVWGGEVNGVSDLTGLPSNTGGRYSPSENRWRPAGPNPPVARYQHAVVWTGNQIIVWGGLYGFLCFSSGSRYDAVTDSWSPTTLSGAPLGRAQFSAVWTGTRMFVWGGADNQISQILNDGSRYDPIADAWSPVSSSGPPGPRANASAVWTGTAVLLWGGNSGTETFGDGGRYDPAADAWSPITTTGAPASHRSTSRSGPAAPW